VSMRSEQYAPEQICISTNGFASGAGYASRSPREKENDGGQSERTVSPELLGVWMWRECVP